MLKLIRKIIKIKIICFFLFVSIYGCASTPSQPILDLSINPGKVRLLKFQIPSEWDSSQLECGSKEAYYFKKEETYIAYISESYFSKRKEFDCELVKGKQTLKVATVKVEEFDYPKEVLHVDKKRVLLSAKDLLRARNDTKILNKIFSHPVKSPYFQKEFILPINSIITSQFGTQRVFNKVRKGQHLGTDFRAAVGEKIKNVNDGKVSFKGRFFFGGNTIIVDHGAGIFSIYSHLKKFLVKKGEMVKRGQIIALSGKTGRVSGPHLHWGVKVMGNSVDAMSLLDAGLL